MENLTQTFLPLLRSNTVTIGLGMQTIAEAFYRGVAEHNTGALVADVVSAGLLGLAAGAGLPELGIQASPEIIAYAAAIGFNLPTIAKWALGAERFGSSSLPIGLTSAAAGLLLDASGIPLNVNAIARTVVTNLANMAGFKPAP